MPSSSKAHAKKGRAAFKPPRPTASKPSKPNPARRRKSAPVTTISSSSDPEDDEIASAAADPPSESEIESSSASAAEPSSSQDPPLLIPPKLITRIVYETLEKRGGNGMSIGKEATALAGKYIDTFLRETVARAAFERSQADKAAGTGDGFLEVGYAEGMRS